MILSARPPAPDTPEGSARLARLITEYWFERGFAGIAVETVPIYAGPGLHYAIRSNIGRSGYPPRQRGKS